MHTVRLLNYNNLRSEVIVESSILLVLEFQCLLGNLARFDKGAGNLLQLFQSFEIIRMPWK